MSCRSPSLKSRLIGWPVKRLAESNLRSLPAPSASLVVEGAACAGVTTSAGLSGRLPGAITIGASPMSGATGGAAGFLMEASGAAAGLPSPKTIRSPSAASTMWYGERPSRSTTRRATFGEATLNWPRRTRRTGSLLTSTALEGAALTTSLRSRTRRSGLPRKKSW